MIGMQYNNTSLQAKGVLEVGCFASSIPSAEAKCKKVGNFTSNEPISVLDNRSPSPSTSTSTLSSSFGGTNGGGTTENTQNLLVGSHRNTLKGTAVPLDPITTASAAGGEGGGGVKEEWVTELSAGLELSQDCPERYNLVGLEDWDAILSESTGGQEDQSLIKWIAGDIEDPCFSLKQLLQGGGNSNEIESNVGFSAGIDQSSGFEALTTANSGNVLPTLSSSPLGLSGSGISLDNNNAKFGSANKIENSQNVNFSLPANNLLCVPNGLIVPNQQQLQFTSIPEQKVPNFMPHVMITTPQFQNGPNLNLLNSLLSCATNQDQPQAKRQNLGILNPVVSTQIPRVPLLDRDPNFLMLIKQQELQLGLGQQLDSLSSGNPQQKPFIVPKQEMTEGNCNLLVARHQQQVVYDQLFKATELVLARNFSHAQGILARLNHQLSPAVKPFQRAAIYFKEALELLLLMPNRGATSPSPMTPTPLDGIFKMGAYKMLSEVSALIQFRNFTSNQALLEALDDAENIHIVDFDIGCGAQWSSFMQELPRKNRGAVSLKITAFASPSTYHPVEFSLMHESLTQFANDLGIQFQLEVENFDSFEPSGYASSFRSSQSAAIAVNFPLWSISSRPTILPSLLCFIKQLSPKVVVMLDHGCERFELPPSHHMLNALQYYEVLLDSIDAVNIAPDFVNKIERFLIQPRIESIVFGRLQSPNQIPPWMNLFASAGFSSVPISIFAETQAECVVKRSQVRGFQVEKRQASLVFFWQRRELMSASVWKC